VSQKTLAEGKMIDALLGILASILGVLGIALRKTRCSLRRVDGHWDGGVSFTDRIEIVATVK